MAIEGKRILVTGGAGFIASHLIDRLVDANEVTVFDTFRRNALRGTRLEEHPHLRLVVGDVLDAEALKQTAAGHDVFIHAAAYGEALGDIEWLTLPVEPPGRRHIYQSYVVVVAVGHDRDGLIACLREGGVESTIGT